MSERRHDFLLEGCSKLAENVSEAFRLAGWPITPFGVADVVASMPWNKENLVSEEWKRGACSRLLKAAYDGCEGGDRTRFDALAQYFIAHIPSRSYESLDMLRAAFCGVLRGIDWPEGQGRLPEAGDRPIDDPPSDSPPGPVGTWECPSCLSVLNLPPDVGGRRIKCPKCGHKATMPEALSPN